MCVICVSNKGVRQPNAKEIEQMWNRNPDGSGYMFVRDGKVNISKGYMTLESYLDAINNENFGVDDVVVYHLRISTQAGITPQMTHPFPLTSKLENCKVLDMRCGCGVAHNGIIQLTSDASNKEYNDTALFITKYLVKIIRNSNDLADNNVRTMIQRLTNSKFAILDKDENLMLVGDWVEQDGLMYSNNYHFDYDKEWMTYLKRLKTGKNYIG